MKYQSCKLSVAKNLKPFPILRSSTGFSFLFCAPRVMSGRLSVVIPSLGNHVILSLSCLSFLCPPVIRFQVQKDSERGRPLTHYYCRHILTAVAASFQIRSLSHTFSLTFRGMQVFFGNLGFHKNV